MARTRESRRNSGSTALWNVQSCGKAVGLLNIFCKINRRGGKYISIYIFFFLVQSHLWDSKISGYKIIRNKIALRTEGGGRCRRLFVCVCSSLWVCLYRRTKYPFKKRCHNQFSELRPLQVEKLRLYAGWSPFDGLPMSTDPCQLIFSINHIIDCGGTDGHGERYVVRVWLRNPCTFTLWTFLPCLVCNCAPVNGQDETPRLPP